jgi:hypothetical protein
MLKKKYLIIPIAIILIGAVFIPTIYGLNINQIKNLNLHDVTIIDDYSYPGYFDYDYGLGYGDIHINNKYEKNGEITISADIHNYGICKVLGGYGWYSSTGRSCWVEWDFNYSTTETVDISFRCIDDVSVHWRVELDSVELASPNVPGVGSNLNYWKIVTIEDVLITEGSHTLFLGTYQQDYYPDYKLDWVKIGDIHIEGEKYDRMGGNDPNSDWRGVRIDPSGANPPTYTNLAVQLWNGDPLSGGVLLHEDFVGEINSVMDRWHVYPGNYFDAHYIENEGVGVLEYIWTPRGEIRNYDIYVVVDPYDVLEEINETNNVAYVSILLEPPESLFQFKPLNPTTKQIIYFNDHSTDIDGRIVSWWWDFGNGYYSDLQNPVFQYHQAGTYVISLTVTDDDGLSDNFEREITVLDPLMSINNNLI